MQDINNVETWMLNEVYKERLRRFKSKITINIYELRIRNKSEVNVFKTRFNSSEHTESNGMCIIHTMHKHQTNDQKSSEY